MYLASGYRPVGPSEDDLSRLSSAQAEVSAAEQTAASARAALAAVLKGPSRSEVVAAEGEVEIARAEVERAKADRREAVDRAEPEDRDRVRREHDMHVLEAEKRLQVAEARLAELLAPREQRARSEQRPTRQFAP